MIPRIHIIRTPDGVDFPLPSYTSRHHVGLILRAAIPSVLKLDPSERALVPVGFGFGVPDGLCGQVVSLPAVAVEKGLIVLDSPQIINPADREALFVLLQNASRRQLILRRGEEIAQLLISPVLQICWNEVSGQLREEHKEMILDSIDDAEQPAVKQSTPNKKRTVKSVRERVKASNES